MPWNEMTRMSQRQDFLKLSQTDDISFAELCRRFGISRKTGYKWKGRGGEIEDRSRRPLLSPERTAAEVEARVIELRQKHPAWGGRKIARRLLNLGVEDAPAPSTVTNILRRRGLLESRKAGEGGRYRRFEHLYPNALWQMDFKGDFGIGTGRCHALTALDDHARYNVVLKACSGTSMGQVQPCLIEAFRRYGLPERINTDNGQPWGSPSAGAGMGLSALSIWLIRLGVRISFSAPAHPQTNGKDERFHRSLDAEVLAGRHFRTLQHVQQALDHWRPIYNHERPHDALGMQVPADRYRPSLRSYPEQPPPIEYSPADQVIKVRWNGELRFAGRRWKVSSALKDEIVALRRVSEERYDLYYCHHRFGSINLTEPECID